jgi:putative tricarboxylic transport membrane protein
MHRPRLRRPGELGFAGIILIFALIVLYLAYRISGLSGPSSAGVFPMLAGLVMVAAAVRILLETWRMQPESDGGADLVRRFLARIAPAEVAIYTLIVVAFMVALKPLGFVLASFLFLMTSFLYLHRKGILPALLISGGTVAVILVVFRHVFQVILPEGPWP